MRIVPLSLELIYPLSQFFRSIVPDSTQFHPHDFTVDEASKLCRYHGKDFYCVADHERHVLAYGMLRGWDAGYQVPSLGIAVHPLKRSLGIGKAMMLFLHATARVRGSKQIRLRVHQNNTTAISLYESLGYRKMATKEDGQLVWITDI